MIRELCCGDFPFVQPTAPAIPLEKLLRDGCQDIPEAPGVYWVFAPEGMPILFHQRPYNPRARLYPLERLMEKWEKCAGCQPLYIGKAEGRRGLRQRLKQYMDYGQGTGNIHRGGRAIWQIEHPERLLLAYALCESPSEWERQLLLEYHHQHGTYPLANWRR